VELARLRERPIARIAAELGISDATLHNWLKQADIDEGVRDGLTTEERAELAWLAPGQPHTRDGERDPQAGGCLLRP
jgi:transposase-like protein